MFSYLHNQYNVFLCIFSLCVSLDVLVVLRRVVETHSSGILSLYLFSMLSLSFVNLNVTWHEQKQCLTWAVGRGQIGGFRKRWESKQSQEESSGGFKGLETPCSFRCSLPCHPLLLPVSPQATAVKQTDECANQTEPLSYPGPILGCRFRF